MKKKNAIEKSIELSPALVTMLLNQTFKNKSEVLMEIVAATPNPGVAVEMLLGVYVDPEIPVYMVKKDNVIKVTGFNKWTNEICYTEVRQDSQPVYYNSEEFKSAQDAFGAKNYSLTRDVSKKHTDYSYMHIGKYIESNSSMNFMYAKDDWDFVYANQPTAGLAEQYEAALDLTKRLIS